MHCALLPKCKRFRERAPCLGPNHRVLFYDVKTRAVVAALPRTMHQLPAGRMPRRAACTAACIKQMPMGHH